jgi:excisionase family DNA binding protein
METKKLVMPAKAAEMLGVTVMCLRVWENEGKIECVKTLGGHRRYKLDEIKKLLGITKSS